MLAKQVVSVNSAGHWPQQRLSVGLVHVLLLLALFHVCLLRWMVGALAGGPTKWVE